MLNAELADRITELVATHGKADRPAFLGARFDAGLAWVHFPPGCGGSGLPRTEQGGVEEEFARFGAPPTAQADNVIGYGMAAPTILEFGSDEQRKTLLRPIFTGEDIWCQLFSEPGAGSDLAAVATRAIRDADEWIVSGQKVWTSFAHSAKWAILLARTNPDVPKHRGLTYFIADMTAPGVEVRPLRQITGEAEFNEVFFTDVRIPDSARLGEEGNGWAVAQATLMNERMAISGGADRESGMVGLLTELWRSRPELRRPALHDRLMRLWVDAEVYRQSTDRQRQQLLAGRPGPDGSGSKITYAQLNQDSTALELEVLGAEGLQHEDWSLRRPTESNWGAGGATHRYLRAKGNSIEGGTSEILLNVIAERVLGLPREPRSDTGAWKGPAPMTPDDGRRRLVLTEDQEALRTAIRDLLSDHSPWPAVLARTESDEPYDMALWGRLGALGVTGLLIPEELGGSGADASDVAVVAEQIGAFLAPVPFLGSAVLATEALLAVRSEPLAAELLGQLATGKLTATLGVSATTVPGGILSTAVQAVGATLTGTVTPVIDLAAADVAIVLAWDEGEPALYAVPLDHSAAVVTPITPLDLTRTIGSLQLTDAPGRLIVRGHSALAEVATSLVTGAAMLAAEQVGIAQWSLDTTVSYLKDRHQFGRPIGSFQALKHRVANVWRRTGLARAAALAAADTLAREPDPDEIAILVAVAASYCSETAVFAAEEMVQLHGGIGMTWEHPAHLYLARAKADELLFGTPDQHRSRLGDLVRLSV